MAILSPSSTQLGSVPKQITYPTRLSAENDFFDYSIDLSELWSKIASKLLRFSANLPFKLQLNEKYWP